MHDVTVGTPEMEAEMKHIRRKLLAAVLAGTGLVALSVQVTSADSNANKPIVEADVLVGVTPPYTGAANAIRGIPGGGAPWVIGDADLRLRADGSLRADIAGLVIDPAFPNPAIAGTNPVPQWKLVVSCLSTVAGSPVTTNVSSAPFAADAGGNAKVSTSIALPHPCIAPIVFVAAAAGPWFAATGA